VKPPVPLRKRVYSTPVLLLMLAVSTVIAVSCYFSMSRDFRYLVIFLAMVAVIRDVVNRLSDG
jgi:hypothetical protein